MNRPEADPDEGAYVSTPQGIFTASGVWFSATEEALRRYAEVLFDHVPLAVLLRRAERWLHSAQALAVWMLPLLLLVLPPLAAAGAALTLFIGWKVLSPSFVSRVGAAVLRVLERPVVQGLFYVFMLSIIAAQAQYAALGVGIAGFVLLRWGLVERALHPLVRRLWRSLYALPVPDQVLRAFMMRAAMRHGVSLPQLDRMEHRLFDLWYRHEQ